MTSPIWLLGRTLRVKLSRGGRKGGDGEGSGGRKGGGGRGEGEEGRGEGRYGEGGGLYVSLRVEVQYPWEVINIACTRAELHSLNRYQTCSNTGRDRHAKPTSFIHPERLLK